MKFVKEYIKGGNMRNMKGQKLGKRKQKRVIAAELGLKNPIEEIDRMDLDNLKRLLKNRLTKS